MLDKTEWEDKHDTLWQDIMGKIWRTQWNDKGWRRKRDDRSGKAEYRGWEDKRGNIWGTKEDGWIKGEAFLGQRGIGGYNAMYLEDKRR